MSADHFESIAEVYAGARPPYPHVLWEALASAGVTGAGRRVLEIGAGTGLATRGLVEAGCEVVAVEPGKRLAALLRDAVPEAEVVVSAFEQATFAPATFDAAVAATSLHWLDLDVALPSIAAALRPDGWLAEWRTVFGDDSVRTEFRDRVEQVVAARAAPGPRDRELRPNVPELTEGGLFRHQRTQRWRWSVDLTTAQVRSLFRTFSDWSEPEVDAVAEAADRLGGVVTEHYQTVLHLLRRDDLTDR